MKQVFVMMDYFVNYYIHFLGQMSMRKITLQNNIFFHNPVRICKGVIA